MKKSNVSKLTLAVLAIGAVSGLGVTAAKAAQQLNYKVLGSGSQVRTNLIEQNSPNSGAPAYLAAKEGEGKCGEGKCGEGKCGEGKDEEGDEDGKTGGEGSCGH